MQYTTNYNYSLPESDDELETASRVGYNSNFSDIDTQFGELEARDYIVEQSISGDIIYRKWNSGFLEVEGNKNVTTENSTSSGNGYYTEGVYIDLPVTFVSCKNIVFGCSDSGFYATRYGAFSSQTNRLGLRVCATRTISAGNHLISFRAVGTWK